MNEQRSQEIVAGLPKTETNRGESNTSTLAICTIISKNYLAHARCLTDSFLAHHPEGRVFVLLVDSFDGYFDPSQEKFITVNIQELDIPKFKPFAFRYSVVELSTAVKPFFLEFLFEKFRVSKLCYFDPDIIIYSPLEQISKLLDSASIVLTPHLSGFLNDEDRPNELNILQAGAYNLGFIGLSQTDQLSIFLKWWQRKLLKYSTSDIAQGLFTDQRWIDLAPTLFTGVHILHDTGHNVAYWNLYHRQVRRNAENFTVNNTPLCFFHFSGYSPDYPNMLSKHQNRFKMDEVGEAKELYYSYAKQLLAAGYEAAKTWSYGLGFFDDKVAIPDFARWLYRETDPDGDRWTDPFDVNQTGCYRDWLNSSADDVEDQFHPQLTRLALEVYQRRADLQQAFPRINQEHRLAFAVWFIESGKDQLGLHDFFLQPIRRAVEPPAASRNLSWRLPDAWRLLSRILLRLNYSRFGRAIKKVVGVEFIERLKSLFLGIYRRQFTARPSGMGKSGRLSFQNTGVNVAGYLRSETGMGEAMRSTLRSLISVNYPTRVTTITKNDLARKEDRTFEHIASGNPFPINLLHVNAEQSVVIHNELGPDFFQNKYNIGYWYWETASFPEIWHNRFDLYNEIWVASTFTQSTLSAVAPIPVIRMRPSIQIDQFSGYSRSHFGLPDNCFIFLFTFDMLSIAERKNPASLFAAYRQAFGKSSPHVKLVIKANNFTRSKQVASALGLEPSFHEQFAESIQLVGGSLLTDEMDRPVLNDLYRECDCFISLHRSEGFGLSLAESMYLGKPCIATAYSSNVDFMTAQNSYLVNYQLVELPQDYGPYKKGTCWAEPDVNHAAALMQAVVENRREAEERGQIAAADIRRLYNPTVTGADMVNRFKLISSWVR
jgi:glycosyltransferase involved in cell wall biosynthesis